MRCKKSYEQNTAPCGGHSFAHCVVITGIISDIDDDARYASAIKSSTNLGITPYFKSSILSSGALPCLNELPGFKYFPQTLPL
jgi:hypothetical protein